MSHLLLHVQHSDCLSAEKRGLTGGIPSLCERKSRWELRRRRGRRRGKGLIKVRICSFIRVAAELRPFELQWWAIPPRTNGLFLALFSPAITALFLCSQSFLSSLWHTSLYCNSAGSGLNLHQACRHKHRTNTHTIYCANTHQTQLIFSYLYIHTYSTLCVCLSGCFSLSDMRRHFCPGALVEIKWLIDSLTPEELECTFLQLSF